MQDLLDQPSALASTLDNLEASPAPGDVADGLARGRFRKVVLTGMGSSFHALGPLHLRLIESGISSVLVETSELVHYMPALVAPDSLLVVVSQSGASAEVIRLLEAAGGRVPVVAVTNTPSSPLARGSQFVVETRAGEEATVSTKTYVASLAALEWLGAVLTGAGVPPVLRVLRSACAGMAEYLSGWTAHVESLTRFLEGMDHIFLVGRGRSLASAGTGGLILKEAAHFPAEGMSSAAFRHGPLEMVRPGLLLCVFAGEPPTIGLNRRLAADVSRGGGKVAWVAEDADLDALRIAAPAVEALPLMEILPVQMISLALANRAGREPGAFVRLLKVTTIE